MSDSRFELTAEEAAKLKAAVEEVAEYTIYGNDYEINLRLNNAIGELQRMKRELQELQKFKAALRAFLK